MDYTYISYTILLVKQKVSHCHQTLYCCESRPFTYLTYLTAMYFYIGRKIIKQLHKNPTNENQFLGANIIA